MTEDQWADAFKHLRDLKSLSRNAAEAILYSNGQVLQAYWDGFDSALNCVEQWLFGQDYDKPEVKPDLAKLMNTPSEIEAPPRRSGRRLKK